VGNRRAVATAKSLAWARRLSAAGGHCGFQYGVGNRALDLEARKTETTGYMMTLRRLLEKSFEADPPREMIGFTTARLMEWKSRA
jgi:hypothetical protein